MAGFGTVPPCTYYQAIAKTKSGITFGVTITVNITGPVHIDSHQA
jgi:hypothetical protein